MNYKIKNIYELLNLNLKYLWIIKLKNMYLLKFWFLAWLSRVNFKCGLVEI